MELATQVLGINSRVNHPTHGKGVIVKIRKAAYDVCFVDHGIKHVGLEYQSWEIIDAVTPEETISFSEAEKSLMKILRHWSDIAEPVDLGDKWDGGKIVLQPADHGLKSKEIPIDVFFHKIVMVRDRLRVMEQRINSSKLSDEEKVNLQQYITRIYGSLTTFNVLFKHKKDNFVGGKA